MRRNGFLYLILGLTFCACGYPAGAQKTEFRVNAYTGIFGFHGDGAASTTWMNRSPYVTPQDYTTNSYGKHNDEAYAFELQGQRVTRNKWLFGLGAAFESLTSRVAIDTITADGFILQMTGASGQATLRNTFITLNPYIGRRFALHTLTLDLSAGVDLGYCLESREEGSARAYISSSSTPVTSDTKKPKPSTDLRPRIQAAIQYDRFGLLLGYSYGLTNFQSQPYLPNAYTGFFRLGVSVRVM